MAAILDKKSVHLMRTGFQLCNLFSMGPYRWESYGRAPHSVKGFRARLLWYVNILLVASQAAFTLAQLWRTNQSGTTVYKIYMLFSTSVYVYSTLFQVANVRMGQRLPKFVESYIFFFNGLKRTSKVRTPADLMFSWRCKFILTVAFCALRPLPIFVPIIAIVRPALPDIWTSIVSDPFNVPWVIRAFVGLLQGYIFSMLTEMGLVWISSGFPFLIAAANVLNILKQNVTAVHGSPKQLQFAQNVHIYEKLRLFVMEYDQIFMIVLIACKVCLISLATFCTCGAVRCHRVLALFLLTVSIISIFCLIVYQMLLGDLNHRSRMFLRAIKIHVATKHACPKHRKTDLDYTCRYLLRMRDLRVQMGSVYFVDKPIVLTIFKIMFDSVINFLILSK